MTGIATLSERFMYSDSQTETNEKPMNQAANTDFDRIIQGCIKWDRNSQQQLYRLYYAYGMSISIRYVNEEDEAIQVLNDAFLKVFKHIRKYKQNLDFKPWFRAILVNTAINHIKKREKFKKLTFMENDANISTQEDILSKLSYDEIIEMVQSLSLAYRTVFNMYVIDGYKHHEIARELGITVGTSKSNLSKARANLREILQEKLQIRNV